MKPNSRNTKPPNPAARERPARESEDAREPRREREWRIGATQIAAPSTRRWRRAGRFEASR